MPGSKYIVLRQKENLDQRLDVAGPRLSQVGFFSPGISTDESPLARWASSSRAMRRRPALAPYRCAHARPCFTIFLISESICYAEDRDLVPYIETDIPQMNPKPASGPLARQTQMMD